MFPRRISARTLSSIHRSFSEYGVVKARYPASVTSSSVVSFMLRMVFGDIREMLLGLGLRGVVIPRFAIAPVPPGRDLILGLERNSISMSLRSVS